MKTLSYDTAAFTHSSQINELMNEATLNSIANDTLFMKRKRKLSGARFFHTLFDLVRAHPAETLSDMAISFFKQNLETISRQAFDQRFSPQSVSFMRRILEKLLTLSQPRAVLPKNSRLKEIQILDSSLISKQPYLKMQLEYRMFSGQLTYLLAEPGTNQDHCHCDTTLQHIEKDVLYLRDKGYYKIPSMQKIGQAGAYFISRMHAETVFYLNGKKYSIGSIVKSMILEAQGSCELNVELSTDHRLPVRMIIRLINPEQARERIKRSVKQARSHHSRMNSCSIWSGCADILLTNAPATMLDEQSVFEYYSFRTQIEILFRALKSFLKVFYFKQVKSDRVYTLAYVKMIAVYLTVFQVSTHAAICYNRYATEVSQLKAFRILCRHFWQEFLVKPLAYTSTKTISLDLVFTLFAQKQAPKGKRTPYEIFLTPT